MVRLSTRAALAVALALTGFLSAVLLAGCGGGGTAGSGTRSATIADRTTRTGSIAVAPTTDTAEASTLPTETRVAATVTETKPVITATTTTLTETRPSLTVNTSTTVVTVAPPPATTTASESTGKNTPAWVWVVIVVFAGTVIGLMVALLRRHPHEVSAEERRRNLDVAVSSWTGAGWMIESQGDNTAILIRDGERMMIAVDQAGHVTSAPPPPPPQGLR